jgi:hypothetical protein
MASSVASSSTTVMQDVRQQAGPLPPKRGEIGYREEEHGQSGGENRTASDFPVLPARHPADRDPPASLAPSGDDVNPSSSSTSPPAENAHDVSSTHSCDKSSLISFIKGGKAPCYFGVCLTSWIAVAIQLFFILATTALWVISSKLFLKGQTVNTSSNLGAPVGIFIHIIFAILMFGQLLLFERRIFQVRAERFVHLHPSAVLPTSNRRADANPYMPLAPWNRPPLPTYAAALAQSGHGTGDVEDNVIAVPPPPAYGNTRGSTLLLAGYLRESLRAQRPRSAESYRSQMNRQNERPMSYRSTDEEWEAICDAERARRLEETLTTLERPQSRSRAT